MKEKKVTVFNKILLPIILILVVIGIDQATKIAVVKYNDNNAIAEGENPNSGNLEPTWLSQNPTKIVSEWLRITLTYNNSAIFGNNFGLPENIVTEEVNADEFENKILNNLNEYHKKVILENYIKNEEKNNYALKKDIDEDKKQQISRIMKEQGYTIPLRQIILISTTSLAIVIILLFLSRIKPTKLFPRICISLIIGGAFGNLLDRVFGYIFFKGEMKLFFEHGVVDWIDAGIPAGVFGVKSRLPFYIFNIADSFITVSIILLLIYILINKNSSDMFITKKKAKIDDSEITNDNEKVDIA